MRDCRKFHIQGGRVEDVIVDLRSWKRMVYSVKCMSSGFGVEV